MLQRQSPCHKETSSWQSSSGQCRAVGQFLEHSSIQSAPSDGLSNHAERLLYSLSDAAVDPNDIKRAGGWVEPLADGLESILKFFQSGLDTAHVPYSYGFSIILLTLTVKVVTFPLIKQQIESSMAVQSLKPRLDLIKQRFGEDKDRISKETSILYEQAGVNPLAGCLPSIATIPIFIGLYSSLSNASLEGLFDTEGFFWIPSLAGPTTVAARQAGSGIAWLYPLVDGAPSIGWDEASAYLVLPVLLVLVQYAANAIVNPPLDPEDPNSNTARALSTFLPLMLGFFSLNVPSGLSLYYFSNTLLTTMVQIYLKKLGGANVVVNDLGPVTKPGSGRRLGAAISHFEAWVPTTVILSPTLKDLESEEDVSASTGSLGSSDLVEEKILDPTIVSRRVKRKKMVNTI